jgi:WD40 repeat protein
MRAVPLFLVLLLIAASVAAQEVDRHGLYREPFLRVDPGTHTAPIRGLAADAAGRFLVTSSDDKTVRVWSAEDGHLLRTIQLPAGGSAVGAARTVALSPDGGTIAAGSQSLVGSYIYLFDRVTGREIGRISDLPSSATKLAYSPDGSKLAVALNGADGVRLFDARTFNEIAADIEYGAGTEGLTFAYDGRIATASFDGKIRLYGPELDRRRILSAPNGKRPMGVAFSPDGRRLAVGYFSTTQVTVIDAETLRPEARPDTRGVKRELSSVAWSADGRVLYAGGLWEKQGVTQLRAWADGGSGPARDYPVGRETVMALRSLADGRLAVAAADPKLLIMGRDNLVNWQVQPPTADFEHQQDQLWVSPDGTRVRFGFEKMGKSPARFDLRKRLLDSDPPFDAALAAARTSGLDIARWKFSENPTLAGKRIQLDFAERSQSLAVAPDVGSFVIGADFSLRKFNRSGEQQWEVATSTGINAVNIATNGRLLVAAYVDGTIRWHRMEDGAELLAFFPHRDGKRWVAWTPLGYYMAAPGSEDLIQWQINRGLDQAPEVYAVSRFRDRFYRPDVIERVLDELDVQKALNAADRAAGQQRTVTKSVAGETPPRVTIIDPADATFVDKPELTVAYTVEDRPGTAIRRVRLLQDGRVATDNQNLTIPRSGLLSAELRVTLQGAAPTLTLLAESDKGSSDPASIRVRRTAVSSDYKPDLYVLAVGVSTFRKHPELNLSFAAADAADFAMRLKQQEGGLYHQVLVQTLTDDEATRRSIKEGFQWLEREMTTRDVAVVFFSTHGAPDGRGKLLLLPSDVDTRDQIELRDTSITFAEMLDTLARLADRGRVLVFLDACHSGNIIRGSRAAEVPDLDKAASELASAENGVVVFSSSTGTQLSVENQEFRHGAFTEALLEAFDTSSATHEPPYLYVADFDLWLSRRVKALTNGAQTPRTTVPGERFTNPRVFMVRAAPGSAR